jgi:homoserine dehydrogenase
MINIAVLGYGTVGSGVVEVIQTNAKSINKKVEDELNIKYILDLRDFPGDPMEEKIVHDDSIISNDDEIDIVVEVMGGVEPAYTFVKEALTKGKNVATSNKELVAAHGAELIALAKEKSVNFLFEASVGGGIPIIRPLNSSLTSENITEITGILNGTTNYILTKMTTEGSDFAEVLKEAQNKGYAERNPEADVEGYDACRKIAILTSLACGKQVDYQDIYTEGITKISATDIKYAKAMGQAVKLLATMKKVGQNLFCMVCPMLIGQNHPLINVNDVFNGIFIHGNMLDDAMFYGRGAGKLPTASAVVADVIEASRHRNVSIKTYWSTEKKELTDISESIHKYFVRLKKDIDVTTVENVFGRVEMVTAEGVTDEIAFVTPIMEEKDFKQAIAGFDGVLNYIRVAI